MRLRLALLTTVVALVPLAAQEKADTAMGWRIRQEATERSQVMTTLHQLTDVYGPRVTGSPALKAAGEWAAQQLTGWGLKNARLEPWDFGHPGWVNERFAGFITAPVKDSLVGEVVAWTPGTNGAVSAQAIRIEPPARPTQQEFTAFLDGLKGTVKGRIVLIGKPQVVPVSFAPPAKRRDDIDVRAQLDPVNPAPNPMAARMQQPAQPQDGPPRLTPAQMDEQLNDFLVANGALVRVNDAGREHGQIRAFNNRTFDEARAVPTVVIRNEDYGRISRLLDSGRTVELEFTIVNRSYPEGRTAYNVVAEIPGTDKADEVVIIGGHLDSWHSATGATDNAIGAAIALEAARILQALGAKPRRTIRVALWAGEEQGLLGSVAYVREHYGTFEAPKPDYGKVSGYFNLDTGTGRIRGFSVFGPPEAAAAVRAAVAPLDDLGVFGAVATRSRRRGGSDHTSFSEAGLPGIGASTDPIEYMTHTWHTNLDAYERIVPEDTIKSAIVLAAAAYHVAMRDELLPRFTKDAMPEPPAREGETPRAAQRPTAPPSR